MCFSSKMVNQIQKDFSNLSIEKIVEFSHEFTGNDYLHRGDLEHFG